MKGSIVGSIIGLAFAIFLIVGEIKCVIKIFQCDWEPIGKAEVLYTGSALTGLGSIVGWIDIEDSSSKTEEDAK